MASLIYRTEPTTKNWKVEVFELIFERMLALVATVSSGA